MDVRALPVVVIGAGLSGLTAAVQLGRLGVRSVLLDDATDHSGCSRAEPRDDFDLNDGPHRLYERGAAVTGLRSLHVPLAVARRGPNGGYAVWRGKKHTLPIGLCSVLTTGMLGPRAKREIGRVMTSVNAAHANLLQRVSIAEWLRTNVVDDDVRQLVLAFVRYTSCCNDPDRQSAGAAIEQLQLSMGGGGLHVQNGWTTLIDALETVAMSVGATFMRNSRVIAVEIALGRATGAVLSDGTTIPAPAVVIATAPRVVERLLRGIPLEWPSTPLRVAALDIALRNLPDTRTVFAIGIDEPWCFSADSSVARVAPAAGGVVHLAKYLRTGRAGTSADEAQLERAMDLLQPGWRRMVVRRRFVARLIVSHALVAANAGGLSGRPAARIGALPNVFLAGDWVGPVGQLADASVASGMQAARDVVQYLAAGRERDGGD